MKFFFTLVMLAMFVHVEAATAPAYVDWAQLRGLNYKTGRVRDDTKELDGTQVKMAGFMVPFDDDQRQEVSEFLLVNVAGACVHVPPPPPNQIVLVKMPPGKKAKVFWQEPVWVIGTLRIETATSPYGEVSFGMTGISVELAKGF
jgi:uncharacterized protein